MYIVIHNFNRCTYNNFGLVNEAQAWDEPTLEFAEGFSFKYVALYLYTEYKF